MADLAWEFAQAVALAWLCFGFGVVLFRMGLDYQCLILSRGLLFLSPFVLTCFGVHATRENQQLAAIVAAKKSEAISGRVYLTSIERADCGDGYAVTVERYSNGTANYAGQMPDAERRTAGSNARLQDGDEKTRGMSGRILSVPAWREFAGHRDRHKERDL